MTPGPGEITLLLRQARDPNERDARQQLFALVEDELRCLLAARLRRWSVAPTLSATALIDDAFMRLVKGRRLEWEGRGEFFRVASGVIRRILCDQVRDRLRRRRLTPLPPGVRDQFPDGRGAATGDRLQWEETMHALLEALARLEQDDPDAAAVFELRFFGGRCLVFGSAPGEFALPEPARDLLPFREAAEILGIPRATAFAHWTRAVGWFQAELRGFAPPDFQDAPP